MNKLRSPDLCPECDGAGWVPGIETRCCGRSDWECGGRGCTGPEPEQVQEQCEYCRGSGEIAASGEEIPSLSNLIPDNPEAGHDRA
jgi:DnaJ-class molecular chaperone